MFLPVCKFGKFILEFHFLDNLIKDFLRFGLYLR